MNKCNTLGKFLFILNLNADTKDVDTKVPQKKESKKINSKKIVEKKIEDSQIKKQGESKSENKIRPIKTFSEDYNFLVSNFLRSDVIQVNQKASFGKKKDKFLDANKDLGKISYEASMEEGKKLAHEVKVSFSLTSMIESIINLKSNEFDVGFYEKTGENLAEFLNKAYELRVKMWTLSNIENELNYCYSELKKIKNTTDFIELNEKIEDFFEVINDLQDEILDLEEEIESRWRIDRSIFKNNFSSFNFVFSFLTEDTIDVIKSPENQKKLGKDKKFELSFISIDLNLKVYPKQKVSLGFSLKPMKILQTFIPNFEKKDLLSEPLKKSFETLKTRRKIKINARKLAKKIKKMQFLKQKTSKMINFEAENVKKNIENRLNFVEKCLECSDDLLVLFDLIVLYKKSNNDLIYDCKMLLGGAV